MKRERHYCDLDTEHPDSADCGCQCFACTAARSQKRHDDAIEAETVAAIVAHIRGRVVAISKMMDERGSSEERWALAHQIAALNTEAEAIERNDWKRGGHG